MPGSNYELLAEGGQLLCPAPSRGSKDPGAKSLTSAENRDDMRPLAEARAGCPCRAVGARCGKSPTEDDQLGAHSAGPTRCHGLFGSLLPPRLFIEPRLLGVRSRWCMSAPRPHKPRFSCCILHSLSPASPHPPGEGSHVPSDYRPCVRSQCVSVFGKLPQPALPGLEAVA